MNYQIRYKELDKPIGVEDFIEKKLNKLSKFDWIKEEIKIELRRYDKENLYKATFLIHPNGHNAVLAEAKSDNLNTAIDLALEKVVTQLVKLKETRSGC